MVDFSMSEHARELYKKAHAKKDNDLTADLARSIYEKAHLEQTRAKCESLIENIFKSIKIAAESGKVRVEIRLAVCFNEKDKMKALIHYLELLGYGTGKHHFIRRMQELTPGECTILYLSINWIGDCRD